MNYRYTLDKRRGRGYIHICPQCGKKEFRRYVDNQTMLYVADTVGKCNREVKCGYHYPPRDYAKDNPQYYTTYSVVPLRIKKLENVQQEPSFLDAGLVAQSMANNGHINSFTRWLYNIIGKNPKYGIEVVENLIKRYHLGGSNKMEDAVVFWQIDIEGNVRTGKMMRYDSKMGKRLKGEGYNYDWVHASLKRQQRISPSFNMVQCFFGEDQLKGNEDALHAVFESEKTACIASVLYPKLICLATGGLSNLNAEKCKVLKSRKVIFFPDLGCYSIWKSKVNRIAQEVFFKYYHIDDTLEKNATEEEREQGLDLCDYFTRSLNKRK
ncbi:hypothetical protein CLV62_12557 [Dysgonomonas alginatilytica]|uniref:Toprim domain-containing protein n=1 Tax=Dysgonomonas alginatilytica TaxID=1605892 RepID=A0A2V3PM10_9BACT|nr:DUF6371 domain-containing protein [Dysgonomonas alginatilytica]PXV61224.1 hypothetical protein CLV62_12557 [Dysgonomonas alginatilytica]